MVECRIFNAGLDDVFCFDLSVKVPVRSVIYPLTCVVNLYGDAMCPFRGNFTFPGAIICPPDRTYTPKHVMSTSLGVPCDPF